MIVASVAPRLFCCPTNTDTREKTMSKTKNIQLPCFGICITMKGGGGTVTSTLKELCFSCGLADCFLDCRQSKEGKSSESADDARSRLEYNLIVDGIEALILAAACEGINVSSPAFVAAIETAVEAATNKFG